MAFFSFHVSSVCDHLINLNISAFLINFKNISVGVRLCGVQQGELRVCLCICRMLSVYAKLEMRSWEKEAQWLQKKKKKKNNPRFLTKGRESCSCPFPAAPALSLVPSPLSSFHWFASLRGLVCTFWASTFLKCPFSERFKGFLVDNIHCELKNVCLPLWKWRLIAACLVLWHTCTSDSSHLLILS